jgi:hypothetical protein
VKIFYANITLILQGQDIKPHQSSKGIIISHMYVKILLDQCSEGLVIKMQTRGIHFHLCFGWTYWQSCTNPYEVVMNWTVDCVVGRSSPMRTYCTLRIWTLKQLHKIISKFVIFNKHTHQLNISRHYKTEGIQICFATLRTLKHTVGPQSSTTETYSMNNRNDFFLKSTSGLEKLCKLQTKLNWWVTANDE